MTFATITPQGDGNSLANLSGSRITKNLSQPLPRKGTETWVVGRRRLAKFSGFLSQPSPRKGTETDIGKMLSNNSPVLILSQPSPRKGTETLTPRRIQVHRYLAFATITPQGDGNWLTNNAARYGFSIFRNHYPARGRKRRRNRCCDEC